MNWQKPTLKYQERKTYKNRKYWNKLSGGGKTGTKNKIAGPIGNLTLHKNTEMHYVAVGWSIQHSAFSGIFHPDFFLPHFSPDFQSTAAANLDRTCRRRRCSVWNERRGEMTTSTVERTTQGYDRNLRCCCCRRSDRRCEMGRSLTSSCQPRLQQHNNPVYALRHVYSNNRNLLFAAHYIVSQKLCKFVFVRTSPNFHQFRQFPPILIIFGRKNGKEAKIMRGVLTFHFI